MSLGWKTHARLVDLAINGGEGGGTRETTAERPPSSHGVTRVFGDSLAVGLNPLVKSKKGWQKGGAPSRDIVQQVRKGAKHGDTVILEAGTNDSSAADLKRSLSKLQRIAKKKNLRIVTSTVNSPTDQKAKNKLIRNSGFEYVDWARKAEGLGDGIHGGYEQKAKMYRKYL